MKQFLGTIIMILFFGITGYLSIFYSKNIQKYYVSYYEKNQNAAKLNPFLGWMKTPNYVVTLKFVGILCFTAFILLIFALLKKM